MIMVKTSAVVVVFSTCTFFGWMGCASASSFLEAAQPVEAEYLAKEDLEQLVLSGLSGFAGTGHLEGIKVDLADMFASLPKGGHGKLEEASVRYALHRYFVQKHGWYVHGLEQVQDANASSSTAIMKDRVPAFIFGLFEERMNTEGLDLNELAVLAVTLSDLIHAEAVGKLARIYADLKIPTNGSLTDMQLELGLKAYIMKYVDLEKTLVKWKNASQVDAADNETSYSYPAYNDTKMWAFDMFQDLDYEQRDRRNPFVEQNKTFSEAVLLAQEFGHRFGKFQELECRGLQNTLLSKDTTATGRVLLADFYSFKGTMGEMFEEGPAYLRNLGALDETDKSRPRVIITNYITSQSNCIGFSPFYSVCCSNQCHGLVGQLEREIGAPSAPPARIAEVVAQLRSETVDAPRILPDRLLARLEDIAEFNDGAVPLHGRLFAQWMHHAYPRECPYPRTANAERPMNAYEWVGAGKPFTVTEKQKILYRKMAKGRSSDAPEELPWEAEELLVNDDRWTSASLQTVMAALALISFAVPLVRAAAAAFAEALPDYSDEAPAAAKKDRDSKTGGSKRGVEKAVAKKKKQPQEWVA